MLQMHQSAVRGPFEHFAHPLLPGCPSRQHTSDEAEESTFTKERLTLTAPRFFLFAHPASLTNVWETQLLILFSLLSLFFSLPWSWTHSWALSTEWGVIKTFPQEKPSRKHTAGPEWEVYFAWCLHICGMWGWEHSELQEHFSFCTEEFITAPSPLPLLWHPHTTYFPLISNSLLILILGVSLFCSLSWPICAPLHHCPFSSVICRLK